MKYNGLLLIAALALIPGCAPPAADGDLHVTIEGGEGRTIYLESFSGRTPVRLDSAVLAGDGSGSMRLHALPMDFYRLTFDGTDQMVLALDSNSNARVRGSADQLFAPTSLSGSKHAELMFKFQSEAAGYEAERQRIRGLLQENPTDAGLLAELNSVNSAYLALCEQYAKQHSDSPVALSAVSRLDMNKEFALYKKVRNELQPVMGTSGFFKKFKDQVDRVEQQEIAKRLQEEELNRLSSVLPVGGLAPEIKQATPDGGTYSLGQMRGKVVFIDFWASWCKPCRIENPELKKVYDKYKGKGFEILGVSLDRDHAAWVEAIKADGLPWKHVSDLKFWSNAAAQEYAVSSIPYGVLLDRDGKVVAKGLRSHDLDHRLRTLLGS